MKSWEYRARLVRRIKRRRRLNYFRFRKKDLVAIDNETLDIVVIYHQDFDELQRKLESVQIIIN